VIPSRTKKQLAIAVVVVSVSLFAASPTIGSPHPRGEYAQFAHCPLNLKAVTDCVYSLSKSGSFTVGEKVVWFRNPVIFQGGFSGALKGVKSYGTIAGEMLSASPQPIAGGLVGVAPSWWPQSLREWFKEQIEKGNTEVTATLELAAPASAVALSTENLLDQKGTALGLPARIKLENPVFGDNCYVGSEADPVQLNLTSGKSGALEGAIGHLIFNKKYTRTEIKKGRLVDGTFAVPAARGCGGIFSPFVDRLVDSTIGLPSPSGNNSAVLEGTLQDAAAVAVKESE
jgi:hypothetical protein